MKNYITNVCIIICLMLGWGNVLSAQQPNAVLLNQRTDISLSGTKLVKQHYYEIQINNRTGEKYTNVDIFYSSLIKVSKIEAAIKDIPGNEIKKLKKADVKSRSAISDISLYEDNMIYEFTLKHNVYPYILCYSYEEISDEFLYIDYWLPVLDYKIPTQKATLRLTVPNQYKISFNTRGISTQTKDSIGSNYVYTWNAAYSERPESEIYAPETDTYFPKVTIVPLSFFYESRGSFDSWISYGNWQFGQNANLIDLPEEEKSRILFLVKDIADDAEKIKILYHDLQDRTRYVNVSLETGGMIPYPASYVSKNRYGDCKALSNYFMAVLQCAGIQSYYTKVRAGDRIVPVDLNFPSQQSNHILVFVPLKNDSIWLDCTSDGPFGYLGTFTQGREAYLIEKDNSRWITTPKLKARDVEEHRCITGKYSEDAMSKADFKVRLKGDDFEQLSHVSRVYARDDQEIIIRNDYVENGFEMLGFELINTHRDSLFIDLNYQTQTNKLYQKYGADLVVRPVLFDLPAFKKPGERKYPVKIDYPVCKTDSQVFDIPDGYSMQPNVKSECIETVYGQYCMKMIIDEKKLTMLKSFVLYEGNYGLDRYPDFYNFIKKVMDKEHNAIFLLNKK